VQVGIVKRHGRPLPSPPPRTSFFLSPSSLWEPATLAPVFFYLKIIYHFVTFVNKNDRLFCMKKEIFETDFCGKKLTVEFNDLVNQANGSCIVSYGKTVILATAVFGKEPKEGIDFVPLSVEFEERFYSVGKILGSQFQKREGKPSDEAVLSGRIVDRTIRPLFPKWLRNDIQVAITALSIGDDDPDVLAVIAGSLALCVSDIPFNGPVSSIRIGQSLDGEFILNPVTAVRGQKDYLFDLLFCGKGDTVNMIEVGANEVTEETLLEAFRFGQKQLNHIIDFQNQIISKIGKKKREIPIPVLGDSLKNLFEEKVSGILEEKIFSDRSESGKEAIVYLFDFWKKAVEEEVKEGRALTSDKVLAIEYLNEKINDLIHIKAIKEGKRVDGRGLDDIRNLFAKAGGVSESLHGSGIFYRGGTHVLSVLTLGGPHDAQVIDGVQSNTEKHFMLHYNFPPYSVGETGRFMPNRRMIGHGALAEKALLPVIPEKDVFPYTIRIVAESMASNGSTSMASTCAGTIALLDAGVPIKKPVAGIASGLMMDGEGYVVLTDIQGPEDHHGDMDFKVAGTKDGVTAVQMDVKVSGIPLSILTEAFAKAKIARQKILTVIENEISKPRENISPYAPFVARTKVKVEQIGLVIGTAGKTVNEIRNKTLTEIDIEEDGTVYITGKKEGVQEAKRIIEEMTHEYKIGERVNAKIIKIADFGAIASISFNTEGLIHISEIAPFRITSVDKYLKPGDIVPVIIKDVDDKGRFKFSIKDINPNLFQDQK
jgi:polyribonucleotide nucleotidyltransferase